MHELIKGLLSIEVVIDNFIVIGCGSTVEEATDDHDIFETLQRARCQAKHKQA